MGGKRYGCETRIRHLPEDIIISIFLKLPTETVIELRFVCKYWFALVSSSYFINTHLHSAEPGMIITRKDPKLSCVFVTEPVDNMHDTITLRQFTSREDVLGTCNGLVLLGDKNLREELLGDKYLGDRFYVANPATKEVVKLPPPTYGGANQEFGMVYTASLKEYRVIHCFGRLFQTDCEILTLGSKRWKQVNISDSLPRTCSYQLLINAITIKDVAHWRAGGSTSEIVSYDMIEQSFRKTTVPSCFSRYSQVLLLDICGCLSCVGHVLDSDAGCGSTIEIWSLKDDWAKLQGFETESGLRAVATIGNGKVVIFKEGDGYSAYEPELKRRRYFSLPKAINRYDFCPLPHYESLVSCRRKRIKRSYFIKKICSVVKCKLRRLIKLKKFVASTGKSK